MNKIFLTADDLLLDSYRLAQQVYDSGFVPSFIIGLWRGGTPVAIAVHEFLDYLGVVTDHIAIRTSSYTGINEQDKQVRVHGLEYVMEQITADDRLLLVDDVFDSGRSMQAALLELQRKCGSRMPAALRIACPWYKPSRNVTNLTPDYHVHETDEWLVFPHELKGLSLEEIRAGKGRMAAPLVACIK